MDRVRAEAACELWCVTLGAGGLLPDMPVVHFTNLLIVVAAGLAAPLVLGFFPRLRLPAIVLEIVLAS